MNNKNQSPRSEDQRSRQCPPASQQRQKHADHDLPEPVNWCTAQFRWRPPVRDGDAAFRAEKQLRSENDLGSLLMDLVKHNGSWKFRTILRLPPAYGTQRHQFSSKGLPPLYSARSRASCPDVCTPSVCGEFSMTWQVSGQRCCTLSPEQSLQRWQR